GRDRDAVDRRGGAGATDHIGVWLRRLSALDHRFRNVRSTNGNGGAKAESAGDPNGPVTGMKDMCLPKLAVTGSRPPRVSRTVRPRSRCMLVLGQPWCTARASFALALAHGTQFIRG